MTDRVGQPAGDRLTVLGRGLALRCPRCGQGRLFRGWLRMHDRCAACGASFAREQFDGLVANDGRAGCAMGVALALVLLFGLGMAVATVLWSATDHASDGSADAVDLR